MASVLIIVLIFCLTFPSNGGTVNDDAVQKAQLKRAWYNARPIGCQSVDEGGRQWCEADFSTDKYLVRNARRLQEVAKGVLKKKAEREAVEPVISDATEETDGDVRATELLFEAVRSAAKQFTKDQKKKNRKVKGKKKKVTMFWRMI